MKRPPDPKLSTIESPASPLPVEDFSAEASPPALSWVGAVVPKRHARRAVTRSLIKRQIYAAAERHRDRMAPGLWIVRLRSPFDRADPGKGRDRGRGGKVFHRQWARASLFC